jgi:ATP-dependent Lon protease
LRLTTNSLEQYLGIPRYTLTPPNQKTQIGVAMGLAVTENGGILLPVEVATMVGKGELLITGQLGDVMRESAYAALSYIRSRAEALGIDPNFQDNTDLHIHLPENAIPKDGPSAGITITAALISAITKRLIRENIAMTGEITVLGRVLGVGGLKEKVLAAHQANIYHLLVPAENKKDMAEIPAKIQRFMRFTFVETMDQVIEAALLAAPLAESESESQNEQSLPEPRPLHMDERVPGNRDQTHRRTNIPADEAPEGETNEDQPSSLIIPPVDRIARDSYPHIRARDADSQNS